MSIKKSNSIRINLKNMGIKLYYLADWLKISKPTLYKYIDAYENGEIISEKYLTILNSIKLENREEIYDKIKAFRSRSIYNELYTLENVWNRPTEVDDMVLTELRKEIEHDFEKRLLLPEFYETINLLKQFDKNEINILKNQVEAYLKFKKKK